MTIISVLIHVQCLCCTYMYWCTGTIGIFKLMELVINVNRHYFVYELDNDKSFSFSVADDQEIAFGGTDGSEEDL